LICKICFDKDSENMRDYEKQVKKVKKLNKFRNDENKLDYPKMPRRIKYRKIKVRLNYPFGINSRKRKNYIRCRNCGSHNLVNRRYADEKRGL